MMKIKRIVTQPMRVRTGRGRGRHDAGHMGMKMPRVRITKVMKMMVTRVNTTKYVHIKSTTVYAPRRNWDSPQPPTRRLVCPLPSVSGGRGTLAGEKGVGRVPIPTRGIHCGTLYMYVLCGEHLKFTDHDSLIFLDENLSPNFFNF